MSSAKGKAGDGGAAQKTPAEVLKRALTLVELEGKGRFQSVSLWRPLGARGVFGGQVIGQSLVACARTVPADLPVHSLHCYFIMRGDPAVPIQYQVTSLRDGRSFSTRSVQAKQNGQVIFVLIASFQRPDLGTPLRFQTPMPDVPMPETLPTRETIMRNLVDNPEIPQERRDAIRQRLNTPFPIDMRFCPPGDPYGVPSFAHPFPRQRIWVRARGKVTTLPIHVHQCVAAYFSDFSLLLSALMPFGVPNPRLAMIASLDHAMWFHCEFDAGEFMLYDMECERAEGGRALVNAKLYTRSGKLAVSVAQEGVFRFLPEAKM